MPIERLHLINFTHHKYMLGVYSHLVLLVVGYGASFYFPSERETRDLTLYGWPVGRYSGAKI